MRDDDLLLAVYYEIPPVIVSAFTHIEPNLGSEPLQDAEVGLYHNWKPAQIHAFQEKAFARRRVDLYNHAHVRVNRDAVRHISQTSLVGIHEVREFGCAGCAIARIRIYDGGIVNNRFTVIQFLTVLIT